MAVRIDVATDDLLDRMAEWLFRDWRSEKPGEDALDASDARNDLENYLRSYSVESFRTDFTGLGGLLSGNKDADELLSILKAKVAMEFDDAT